MSAKLQPTRKAFGREFVADSLIAKDDMFNSDI